MSTYAMKNLDLTEENKTTSRVIHVDFRRNRPFIDFDPYLDNVSEIHCRCCKCRRPREGAQEIAESWGYVCKYCMDNKGNRSSTSPERPSSDSSAILIA